MPSRLYDKFGNRTDTRVDLRPRNVEYEQGTGPGTGLLARRKNPGMGGGLTTFDLAQKYKDLPMSMIENEANIRRNQGMMYNPNTGTFQRDSMYNRPGFGFGRNPIGGGGRGRGQQAPAMTEPQQMWAQKAKEKMSGVGAPGKVGEKMQSIGDSAWGQPAALTPSSSTFVRSNPYLGTREQNIANAKAAGMFDKIRDEFNKQNRRPGGSWMGTEGDIYNMDKNDEIDFSNLDELGYETASPRDWRQVQNFVKTKAEERALQRGSFVTPQTLSKEDEAAGVKSRVAMENPYGRGSFTRYTDPSKKPQSMVKDDFGNWVPMKPYLAKKKAIQSSKGMI